MLGASAINVPLAEESLLGMLSEFFFTNTDGIFLTGADSLLSCAITTFLPTLFFLTGDFFMAGFLLFIE